MLVIGAVMHDIIRMGMVVRNVQVDLRVQHVQHQKRHVIRH